VFNIVNPYGPFSGMKVLWKMLKEKGSPKRDNIIIGGDLNLTLNLREI
jgi:hypothetical protein